MNPAVRRLRLAVAVIAGLLLAGLGAAMSLGASSRPTDYRGVIAKLNAEIPRLLKAGGTVGLTIALVDGDRTVWRRGFGWADEARKVPVTANTLFHIGSVSKGPSENYLRF